jgi:hypothetical protein
LTLDCLCDIIITNRVGDSELKKLLVRRVISTYYYMNSKYPDPLRLSIDTNIQRLKQLGWDVYGYEIMSVLENYDGIGLIFYIQPASIKTWIIFMISPIYPNIIRRYV